MGQFQARLASQSLGEWDSAVHAMLSAKSSKYAGRPVTDDLPLARDDLTSKFHLDASLSDDLWRAFLVGEQHLRESIVANAPHKRDRRDMLRVFEPWLAPEPTECSVSFDEFTALLTLLAPTPAEGIEAKLEFLFTYFDSDSEGQLSAPELQNMLTQVYRAVVRLSIADGTVRVDSITDFFDKLSMEVDAFIQAADTNGDGKISKSEFFESAERGSNKVADWLRHLAATASISDQVHKPMPWRFRSDKLFRILSVDGGGLRAVVAAAVIAEIEDEIPGFIDSIDLFAGTSAGGVMAELYSMHYHPRQVLDVMLNYWPNAMSKRQLKGAKYDPSYMINMIRDIGGTRRLADVSTYGHANVLVPTFHLGKGRARPFTEKEHWGPKIYSSMPRSDGQPNRDEGELLWELAIKAMAAPAYFPPFKGFIDGGVCINNPAVAALAHALNPAYGNVSLGNVRMLSVGTGFFPTSFTDEEWDVGQFSVVKRVRDLIDGMMEGSNQSIDHIAHNILRKAYMRINPELLQGFSLDNTDPEELARLADRGREVCRGSGVADWLMATGWVESDCCTRFSEEISGGVLGQEMYTCEDCNLLGSQGHGACRACFLTCHRGHAAYLHKKNAVNFVCDCSGRVVHSSEEFYAREFGSSDTWGDHATRVYGRLSSIGDGLTRTAVHAWLTRLGRTDTLDELVQALEKQFKVTSETLDKGQFAALFPRNGIPADAMSKPEWTSATAGRWPLTFPCCALPPAPRLFAYASEAKPGSAAAAAVASYKASRKVLLKPEVIAPDFDPVPLFLVRYVWAKLQADGSLPPNAVHIAPSVYIGRGWVDGQPYLGTMKPGATELQVVVGTEVTSTGDFDVLVDNEKRKEESSGEWKTLAPASSALPQGSVSVTGDDYIARVTLESGEVLVGSLDRRELGAGVRCVVDGAVATLDARPIEVLVTERRYIERPSAYSVSLPFDIGRGRPFVLGFFASWCRPCSQSCRDLSRLARLGKRHGYHVLGVSKEPLESLRAFINSRSRDVDYAVGHAGASVYRWWRQVDFGGSSVGLPRALLIDGFGRVRWAGNTGDLTDEALRFFASDEGQCEVTEVDRIEAKDRATTEGLEASMLMPGPAGVRMEVSPTLALSTADKALLDKQHLEVATASADDTPAILRGVEAVATAKGALTQSDMAAAMRSESEAIVELAAENRRLREELAAMKRRGSSAGEGSTEVGSSSGSSTSSPGSGRRAKKPADGKCEACGKRRYAARLLDSTGAVQFWCNQCVTDRAENEGAFDVIYKKKGILGSKWVVK
jgi:Ca2+-binding EF-hand superfamily protein/peroxiredoxin